MAHTPINHTIIRNPTGYARELRSHSVWKLRTCSPYVDRSTAERTALHLSGSLRGGAGCLTDFLSASLRRLNGVGNTMVLL